MNDWLGLRDSRVVVAGGAGSIGVELVSGFQRAGARVVAVDASAERLEALDQIRSLTDEGGGVFVADLTDRDACYQALEAASSRLGGLEVFVHALGTNIRKPIERFTRDEWDELIATNLSSVFWMAQAALRQLAEQQYGRVVLLSSVAGRSGHKNHGPYAATKGAVNQLTKVMAHEYAESGVTVNAVAPGYMETAMTREYLEKNPGELKRLISLVPAGRLGTIEEVVAPVLFLSSRQAAFITGQIIYVDGGRTVV
jgi:NAD(P)-dependent dehydrogenase (short-subunit alcohol dehydrogenase family)